MRNLRKYMSVLLVVAMMVSCIVPATAATTATASAFQYENEAKTLHDLGLFNGTSTGEFVPDLAKTLDRQTGVVLLVRLLGLEKEAEKMKAADVNAALGKFPDSSSVADWAKNDFAYAVDNKLVKGVEEGGKIYLKPVMALSGKMYATMILRQLGYTDGEAGKGDFKYDDAVTSFSRICKVSEKEFSSLTNKTMTRDDLVGMSFASLSANFKGEKATIISKLVETGVLTPDQAKVAKEKVPQGFPEEVKPGATTPGTTTPTVATSISSVTFANELVETDAAKAKAVVTFGTFPAVDPVNADFSVIEDVYVGSTATRVSVVGSVYALDKAAKTVVLAVPSVSAAGTSKTVKVYVSYKGEPYVQAPDFIASQAGVSVKAEMVTGAPSVAMSQALFEVGKITFEPSENALIQGIKLTRSGLSKDTDVANVSVWDGAVRMNTPAIFSNNICEVTFSNPLQLTKGVSKTLSIKLNIASSTVATSGAQLVVSLAGIDSIKTTSAVSGNFPATSSALQIISVSLGELRVTVPGDAPVTGSEVDVGNDVKLAKIKISNINEAVKLDRVIFTQAGAIADSDVNNLKLFKDGVQVGSSVSLVNRKAIFEFTTPIDILLGGNLFLELRGDIVNGSSRSIIMGIDNVNDIQATGNSYHTTIVSDVTVTGSTLTIKEGSVLVSKDSTSPAAGTIASTVNDKVFTILRLQAIGEPITINKMKIVATAATNGAVATDLTDLKILKNESDGKIVETSVNAAQVQVPFTSSSSTANVTLTSPIKIYPGTPVLVTLTADLTDVAQNRTYKLGTAGVSDGVTYTKVISGKVDQTLNPTAIDGGVMTVGTVAMTAAFAPFSTKYAFSGDTAVKLGEIKLSHNLTEEVKVSNMHVKFDFTNDVVIGDLRNLRATDTSGNVISQDPIATLSNPQTITFRNDVTIKQNEYKNVIILADLATTAHTGNIRVYLDSSATQPGGTARTSANATSVAFGALAVASASTTTISTGGSSFNVTRSAAQDIKPGAAYRGQKNKVIGGFRFESDSSGVEAATVKKLVLTPFNGAEEFTLTCEDASADGTVTLTLNGVAQTAITYTDATDYDGGGASGANDLAACIAATTFTGYRVSRSNNVVTFTATTVGNQTDATVGVTGVGAPTVAVTTQGTGAAEKFTLTCGDASADGTVTLTLNGVDQTTITYTDATDYDAGGASGANDLAACIAATTISGYTLSRNNNVVTFTATTAGNQIDATVAITGTGIAAPTLAVTQQGGAGLGNDAVENIRIVNAADVVGGVYNGNTPLANVGTINGSTEIILSAPFNVPEYSANSSYEIAVIADFKSDNMPAGTTYAIRLGDGIGGLNDVTYNPKTTGTEAYKNSLSIKAGNGVDATFIAGLAQVSITPVAITTEQKNGGGALIGQFTVKNNGSVAIALETIELDDLNDGSGLGGATNATINLTEGSTNLNTTPRTFDENTEKIILDRKVILSAGQTKTITVSLANKGAIANGTTVKLQVVKAGTLYDSETNSGYALTVDNDPVLGSIPLATP